MPLKSGIYGLVRLDNAGLDADDAVALGLPLPAEDTTHLLIGTDRRPAAVSRVENEIGVTVLVGEIEEGQQLARELGLPSTACDAAIAQRALAAFGPQLAARMVGEYSCVSIGRDGVVTLAVSAARRDPLLYALRPGCLAISPSVFALARLAWVGHETDLVGLAASLGRARTRGLGGNRTILQHVRDVQPGETVRIARDGRITRASADLFGPVAAFQGSRADALEAVEALLSEIIGQRLSRAERPAVLLSGGLDSSVLALFMARNRRPQQWLGAITSVAPPGTDLPDERAESASVAQTLGLDQHFCWPAPDTNPYLARSDLFLGQNGPSLNNRPALNQAMHQIAADCGATLLINGTFGEGGVTFPAHKMQVQPVSVARQLWRSARRLLQAANAPEPEGTGFHVRLSRDLLNALPAEFAAPPIMPTAVGAVDGLFGYRLTVLKALPQPNEYVPGALRMDYPYRDLRLLRLFASFPLSFLQAHDGNREFGRHLLSGQVPDDISQRRRGRPASPDHLVRLRAFAPQTRALISGWRAEGVGNWVDLDWLDQALHKVAADPGRYSTFGTQVHLTAMAAVFFSWWQKQGGPGHP